MATPTRSKSAPGKAKSFPVYELENDRILIPKYLYLAHYKQDSDQIEFFDENEEPYSYNFKGKLFVAQMRGAEKMLKVLGKKRGVVGKGRCGTGKTVIGTYIIHRIRGKSLILVDQFQIAEQWVDELLTNLEHPRISFIMPMDKQRKICKKFGLVTKGRKKVDATGHIIIASAQTLMRLPKDEMIPVSLLIVDEAHSFSAPSFAKSIFRIGFRYSVALTATDERPDGLDWVFKDILGKTIVPLKGRRMDPVVALIPATLSEEIQISSHKIFWCPVYRRGRTFWACKPCDRIGYCSAIAQGISKKKAKVAYHEIWARLSNDRGYNKTLIAVIRQLYEAGRNILVLSKFKKHLKFLRKKVIALGVPRNETSLYFGGMDKDRCLPYPITFATFGIAYKALNAPDKDAEVLAMPVSGVEQPAGRVERKIVGKKRPIIADFIIKGAPFLMGQFTKRMKFYEEAGYERDSLTNALDLCGGVRSRSK